ncbi:hypothetical protein K435DRAFT_796098 [Dendrothele bispora CBS 962.96]|uniref:Uncharacterized protein n=1 Tax=Dendrothele bispora (strain CBS 962.96) TaxID=1314807 RepID=A0A4S8M7U4_DENBC|nr:hypothetical protein K435DRAFT_796098 [Dendrothele bispora CBS 962.96]
MTVIGPEVEAGQEVAGKRNDIGAGEVFWVMIDDGVWVSIDGWVGNVLLGLLRRSRATGYKIRTQELKLCLWPTDLFVHVLLSIGETRSLSTKTKYLEHAYVLPVFSIDKSMRRSMMCYKNKGMIQVRKDFEIDNDDGWMDDVMVIAFVNDKYSSDTWNRNLKMVYVAEAFDFPSSRARYVLVNRRFRYFDKYRPSLPPWHTPRIARHRSTMHSTSNRFLIDSVMDVMRSLHVHVQ